MKSNSHPLDHQSIAASQQLSVKSGVIVELAFDGTQVVEVNGEKRVVFPPGILPRARRGDKVEVHINNEGEITRLVTGGR